jgi:hypothetical protein
VSSPTSPDSHWKLDVVRWRGISALSNAVSCHAVDELELDVAHGGCQGDCIPAVCSMRKVQDQNFLKLELGQKRIENRVVRRRERRAQSAQDCMLVRHVSFIMQQAKE